MKISKRQLRRIIKEEAARITERANVAPSRNSNWHKFATELDVGILDLGEIAYDLGFGDFYDMDISISPGRLSRRDPGSFVAAVRAHALAAEDMSDDQILSAAGMEGMI
tara:strand:- start:583 stop:909 length:327 start_codon:yes stop_codon:yes gene_type:complete